MGKQVLESVRAEISHIATPSRKNVPFPTFFRAFLVEISNERLSARRVHYFTGKGNLLFLKIPQKMSKTAKSYM